MPGYLLMVSVGPVQEFIAAARRTRDLWFGSHLLSEVSRAAAAAVRDHGGHLIFPARVDAENVANVILAEYHGAHPADLATNAKQAARAKWEEIARAAYATPGIAAVVVESRWEEQVKDVIEVCAAWVPFNDNNYAAQRKRVARLLAGRKNCRDFLPAGYYPGVPKSSLDGLRETVLRGPSPAENPKDYRKNRLARTRGRLRVRDGEQLDVVGVVKRVWQQDGEKTTYPSVSRIAADPWVRGVLKRQDGRAALDRLAAAGRDILNRIDAARFPQFAAFPLEGTAVYRERHHELWEEAEVPPEQQNGLGQALTAVEKLAGEPNPYLAVLVADGDRMGATIAELTSVADHQRFSAELAGFAAEADAVVARHHGVLVYAGGDDVLAFLPVDKVLGCARALHDTFGGIMTQALPGKDVPAPTLSVGVAIGHFLEDLEDLLGYGRAAEKDAKAVAGKDALAVHLHKRGGSPVRVRAKWGDEPDERLTRFATWLNDGTLPNKVATDFHTVARVYDGWAGPDLAATIRGDVLRVLKAKKPRGDDSSIDAVRDMIRARVTDARSLLDLAAEFLVARQVAAGLRQADPKGVGA